jgi:cell division protein FtsL
MNQNPNTWAALLLTMVHDSEVKIHDLEAKIHDLEAKIHDLKVEIHDLRAIELLKKTKDNNDSHSLKGKMIDFMTNLLLQCMNII